MVEFAKLRELTLMSVIVQLDTLELCVKHSHLLAVITHA